MQIYIYTCPRCGHDLRLLQLTSNPPIDEYHCFNCDWFYQKKRNDVIRIPFIVQKENNEEKISQT